MTAKRNEVLVIQQEQIRRANISPAHCVSWVKDSFRNKYKSQLPAKISVHPQGNDFFTSMPCLLPEQYHRFGIKVVHRILGQEPSLGSDILLYDSQSGDLLAVLDGDWITTMRTGAVVALTCQELRKKGCNTYSFIGLGNTARAAALCLIETEPNVPHFRIFKYKDQADRFVERFKEYDVTFEIVDTVEDFVKGGDVIISCITDASGLICEHDDWFQAGALLIPVHTRGFQNCDLFFDKIYGDDTGHVQGFKYFSRFKKFDELSNVLLGENPGRENDKERIIAYNIGLALHDVFFANHLYEMLKTASTQSFIQYKNSEKFWI